MIAKSAISEINGDAIKNSTLWKEFCIV